MGMHDNLYDIVKILYNDEVLLRLLYYPPTNYSTIPDPLDESLENVLDIDINWEIRDKRIMLIPKSDDLVTEQICRVYLYAGRRRPSQNYQVANQEVIIDVLCHSNFEKDLRSLRISDRINELLVLERITGIGKMDYVSGNQISAPNNYMRYQHIYEYATTKK